MEAISTRQGFIKPGWQLSPPSILLFQPGSSSSHLPSQSGGVTPRGACAARSTAARPLLLGRRPRADEPGSLSKASVFLVEYNTQRPQRRKVTMWKRNWWRETGKGRTSNYGGTVKMAI